MNARWRMAARRPLRGRARWGVAALCLAAGAALAGQARQTPPAPTPPAPAGPPGQPGLPGTVAAGAPAIVPRTFTGTTGLVFNTVRPERVADFELLLAEVQQALAHSANPATQAQAKGWRFFKAAEPGPNGTVMFSDTPGMPGRSAHTPRTMRSTFTPACDAL